MVFDYQSRAPELTQHRVSCVTSNAAKASGVDAEA